MSEQLDNSAEQRALYDQRVAEIAKVEVFLYDQITAPKEKQFNNPVEVIHLTTWLWQTVAEVAREGTQFNVPLDQIQVLHHQINSFDLGIGALARCPNSYLSYFGIVAFLQDRNVVQTELNKIQPPAQPQM